MLLSVLSRNSPASLPAKAAGYSYIAQFSSICRMQHLPPEHGRHRPFSFKVLVLFIPARNGRGDLVAGVAQFRRVKTIELHNAVTICSLGEMTI